MKIRFTESRLKNREKCAANFGSRFFHDIKSFHVLVYQSSHPRMTEMGESTALPQSTTNDRVSNKICYVNMNLFTKVMYNEKHKRKE